MLEDSVSDGAELAEFGRVQADGPGGLGGFAAAMAPRRTRHTFSGEWRRMATGSVGSPFQTNSAVLTVGPPPTRWLGPRVTEMVWLPWVREIGGVGTAGCPDIVSMGSNGTRSSSRLSQCVAIHRLPRLRMRSWVTGLKIDGGAFLRGRIGCRGWTSKSGRRSGTDQ